MLFRILHQNSLQLSQNRHNDKQPTGETFLEVHFLPFNSAEEWFTEDLDMTLATTGTILYWHEQNVVIINIYRVLLHIHTY